METIIDHEDEIKETLAVDLDRGFTEMVRRYQPDIYAGTRRLTRSPEDGADVAQETFLRAYRALETYGPDRIGELRIRPWLWTIALNLCRSRSHKKTDHALPVGFDPSHYDPESADEAAWDRRMSLLTEPQRTAIVLRYVLDLPVQEIAVVTKRPAGTVGSDLARGLERLRRAIQAEELT